MAIPRASLAIGRIANPFPSTRRTINLMNMSPKSRNSKRSGFTLIELLVVIAIIGILAGMLVPALGAAKTKAKVAQTQSDVQNLMGAITTFNTDYGRFPIAKSVRQQLQPVNPNNNAGNPDFTFGTVNADGTPVRDNNGAVIATAVVNPNPLPNASNREIIAALRGLNPDWGNTAWNRNNALNPERKGYLNVKDRARKVNGVDTGEPGAVGGDGVYRDPFGMPYIISLDANFDNRTRDAFYRLESVSAGGDAAKPNRGLLGLSKATGPNSSSGETSAGSFEVNAPAMVWSFGPDRKADSGVPATLSAGKKTVNFDNVTSWK